MLVRDERKGKFRTYPENTPGMTCTVPLGKETLMDLLELEDICSDAESEAELSNSQAKQYEYFRSWWNTNLIEPLGRDFGKAKN